MARDVPSPCCGSFSILVKENAGIQMEKENITGPWGNGNHEEPVIMYTCHCGACGVQYGEQADSRAEAIYNYDQKCYMLWKKNPNGLQGWMMTKPKSKEDLIRRQRIRDLIEKGFTTIYG